MIDQTVAADENDVDTGREAGSEPKTNENGVTEDCDTTHLDDVEAGAGCTEIWEHLSERRADD